MIFKGLTEDENSGWMLLDYTATWPYGYDFMLDAAQAIIDSDFKDKLERVAIGKIMGAGQTERLEEFLAHDNDLRACPNIVRECGVLIVAGVSNIMDATLQFMFYNQLNNVRIYCPSKEFFEKNGERVLDNYMNSIEIKAYCAATRRKVEEELKSKFIS